MAIETRAITLIRTKLQRPRLPDDLIPRRRLLDRLRASSDHKLTLISARAGTGKTTLLAQWWGCGFSAANGFLTKMNGFDASLPRCGVVRNRMTNHKGRGQLPINSRTCVTTGSQQLLPSTTEWLRA